MGNLYKSRFGVLKYMKNCYYNKNYFNLTKNVYG